MLDALLVAAVSLTPLFSHWLAVPLYRLDPMRFCLLAGMLLVADKRHAYLLALLLPVLSCLFAGMPAPMAAFIIAIELSVNVMLFYGLQKVLPAWAAMLLSIAVSKGVYYLLKSMLIAPAVLVGTSLWLQLCLALLYTLLFVAFMNKRGE